jgi:hypothetical protein
LGPHEGPGGTFVRAILPGAQVAFACALDGRNWANWRWSMIGACSKG